EWEDNENETHDDNIIGGGTAGRHGRSGAGRTPARGLRPTAMRPRRSAGLRSARAACGRQKAWKEMRAAGSTGLRSDAGDARGRTNRTTEMRAAGSTGL